MFRLLLWRKVRSTVNALTHLTPWEWARNLAFLTVGFWMLLGIYFGFWRFLKFLNSVQIIGDLLIWKLMALAMMTTFSMVVISSLIISLTTLFYSFDLPFLMESPLPLRVIFFEKSLESTFFSSWMIGLVLIPLVLALGHIKGVEWTFYLRFIVLLIPFLMMATVIGMAFTLLLMFLFPSPRTRDVIWILSSLSIAVVYVLVRIAQPEKLIRPDALQLVAEYLSYLQAPIAPYLPSWWFTRTLWASIHEAPRVFWRYAGLLAGSASASYGALVYFAGKIYSAGYSGAQEGRRYNRSQVIAPAVESRLLGWLPPKGIVANLLWKDRHTFLRDVRNWSQIVLVLALMCVYLYSIQRLPLDTADLKSLISFLNLGIAGFVLSSLGLRFTFPSISLEGRSFWVLRAAPIDLGALMRQKFLFSFFPMIALSSALVLASNHLLQADRFIAWTAFITILVMTCTLCAMGVGFGAMFPRLDYSNIHQVESSAGGFVYMAVCLAYIGLTVALEALPVQMHFQERFGRVDAWHWPVVVLCGAALIVLNILATSLPWLIGRRTLEKYEAY